MFIEEQQSSPVLASPSNAPQTHEALSLTSLTQHLQEVAELPPLSTSSQTQHPVLRDLLQQLEPIDFREAVALESDRESLKQKHYLVTIVRTVREAATAHGYGLCQRNQTIYVYNRAYWNRLEPDELRLFLREAAERLGVNTCDARYHLFTKNLLDQFLSDGYQAPPTPVADTVKVNLQNGTLVVTPQGQHLQPFDPADFLTYQLPYAYNPDATAPRFERFMARVLPAPSCRQVLAEFLGYLFVHHRTLKLEKALLLYGSGANGKSVFYEIVQALLGSENMCSFSLESLTCGQAYARAKLGDKLVNYVSEFGGKHDPNIFKQMVSGEALEARLPYGQPFMMESYAKIIANTNELPTEVEHTNAYFRRFLIVPFSVTIPEQERDPQLAAGIIAEELPGILNWMLVGLQRLLAQRKFSPCEPAQQLLEDFQRQSDSVRLFLEEEGYQADPDRAIRLQDFYADYRGYCSESGYQPVNRKNFRKRLERVPIAYQRKSTGWFVCAGRAAGNWAKK